MYGQSQDGDDDSCNNPWNLDTLNCQPTSSEGRWLETAVGVGYGRVGKEMKLFLLMMNEEVNWLIKELFTNSAN